MRDGLDFVCRTPCKLVIHSKNTPNPVPKQLGGAAESARDMRQLPVYVLRALPEMA
jgi:hypothetical protein